MISWRLAAVAIAAYVVPLAALADDGVAMLQKIAQGSRQLTYSGTFVYRSGDKVETSHISHTQVDGREYERIEVLDGSPREVIREGTEIKCFLPDQKLLIVESRPRQRGFPSILPVGLGSLTEHYTIRGGTLERLAGLESRLIRLEPKDNLRFRHDLWMDVASGLLLKAAMYGDNGEALESFAFSQVKVGGALERDALKPRYDRDQVRVKQVKVTEVKPEEMEWGFRASMPGFRKVSTIRRQLAPDVPESIHVVFSDGLASISVFIEPGNAAEPAHHPSRMGPVNVFHRTLGDHRFIVMGEVPAIAVKRLAEGIERRRK